LKYGQKVELYRKGERTIYQLPDKDALGLANYSEALAIKTAENKRKEKLAFKRFMRVAIATKSKKFASSREHKT
jgi:hypothetical protein